MKRLTERRKMALAGILLAVTVLGTSLSGCGAGNKAGVSPAVDFHAESKSENGGYSLSDSSGEAAGDWDTVTEFPSSENGGAGKAPEAEGESELPASTQAKIIRTRNYELETKEFDSTLPKLQDAAKALGGYVESSSLYAYNEYQRSASLTIRIPADQLDAYCNEFSEYTNVRRFTENTQNVTLQYVDTQSHIEALEAEREALMELMDKAETMDDILVIQSQMTSVRYELESYESQLRVMQDEVDYSTVNIDLEEVERETVTEKAGFWAEAMSGLRDTMYDLGQDLREMGIFLIAKLPVILIVIVLFVIILSAVKRGVKKGGRKNSSGKGGRDRDGAGESEVHIGKEKE